MTVASSTWIYGEFYVSTTSLCRKQLNHIVSSPPAGFDVVHVGVFFRYQNTTVGIAANVPASAPVLTPAATAATVDTRA